MAESAATEPTERSMPAATITKVNPKAITAMVETWMPMFIRFGPVRKRGVAMKRARQRTTSPDQCAVVGQEGLEVKALLCGGYAAH